jgi:hypothetical protein
LHLPCQVTVQVRVCPRSTPSGHSSRASANAPVGDIHGGSRPALRQRSNRFPRGLVWARLTNQPSFEVPNEVIWPPGMLVGQARKIAKPGAGGRRRNGQRLPALWCAAATRQSNARLESLSRGRSLDRPVAKIFARFSGTREEGPFSTHSGRTNPRSANDHSGPAACHGQNVRATGPFDLTSSEGLDRALAGPC